MKMLLKAAAIASVLALPAAAASAQAYQGSDETGDYVASWNAVRGGFGQGYTAPDVGQRALEPGRNPRRHERN